jgi:hypothetical protein
MHDAWNRLVRVTQQDSGSAYTLGEYENNGLHWRTVKRSDARVTPSAPTRASSRRSNNSCRHSMCGNRKSCSTRTWSE